MIKRNLIHALGIVLTIAIFSSCYEAVNSCSEEYHAHNLDVTFISFLKISNNNQFNCPEAYSITDCEVGDTIGLLCNIRRDDIAWYDLPESLTARITTSRGDIEFIKLFDDPNGMYFAIVPPPPRRYVTYIQNENMYPNWPEVYLRLFNLQLKITSECNPNDGILSISPGGDILTAKIIDKNKILIATLNLWSK